VTPAALLTDLYRRGATLRAVGDRVGVKVPGDGLSEDLRSAIVAHKPELVRLLAMAEEYRTLLRHAFALTATGAERPDEVRRGFLDEQARLTDDLGPELGQTIVLAAGRTWRAQTGICPWCDDADRCHEPGYRGDGREHPD